LELARFKTAIEARRLRSAAQRAERREARALERAGALLHRTFARRSDEEKGASLSLFAKLAEIDQRADSLRASLETSLANDRRDFAEASELARWAVILRGVLDRVALRERARRADRERTSVERALGLMAFDGNHAALRSAVPESLAAEIEAARGEAAAASVLEKQICEPYGGEPLPKWMSAVARETRAFARHVWRQLSGKIFLRAPAIAGLFAGWWIARTFTDSALESVIHDVGLGGRRGVSPTTMSWLSFWLPLFAAAACSYLGGFLAARVLRRYAPQDSEKAARE
jgi:hypothetical protein